MNDTDARIPTNTKRRTKRKKPSEKLRRRSSGMSSIVPTTLDSTDSMSAGLMEKTMILHSMDSKRTMLNKKERNSSLVKRNFHKTQ